MAYRHVPVRYVTVSARLNYTTCQQLKNNLYSDDDDDDDDVR